MDSILNQALEGFLGLLRQLMTNLLGPNGSEWGEELKKFLRKEPCWRTVGMTVTSTLRSISVGQTIVIRSTTGEKTFAKAKEIFTAFLDADFERWGTNVPSAPTGETPVVVHEMIQDAKFAQMFIGDLDRLCLSQEQIIDFVVDHRNWLRTDGYGTFFLFKVGTEFFVARVYVRAGGLEASVRRLSDDYVWRADYGHRVVIPQLVEL